MYAFITPMPLEAQSLLKDAEVTSSTTHGHAIIFEARYQNHPYLVVQSGVGKAFAAASAQAIIDRYPDIQAIIVVGVAGSINKIKAPLCCPVLAKRLVQHDIDTTGFGDPFGLIPGLDEVDLETDSKLNYKLLKTYPTMALATIATGDQFVSSSERKQWIGMQFGAVCVDMESAAAAQIAFVNNIPFSALRVISDAENPKEEYEQNAERAAAKAGEIIRKFIVEYSD